MGVKGRVHSIESFGTLDGPGIRYVLFLQGCALKCLYCHNPDTWKSCGGKIMDSDGILSDILTYQNFIASGGVTLSGGEPLLQPEFALELLKKCAGHGIHTALDTAGTLPLRVSAPVLNAADLILLDIKSLDEDQCVALTGQGNNSTLGTLDYCEKIKKPVWIRHVLLPGYTLDEKRLTELAKYLSRFACVQTVELLPFHKMGEYKWNQLGLRYDLGDTPPPTKAQIDMARDIFKRENMKTGPVKVGQPADNP